MNTLFYFQSIQLLQQPLNLTISVISASHRPARPVRRMIMKILFMHGVTSVMENISSSHWSQMACYDTTAVERWFVPQEVEMVRALSSAVAA